VAPSLQDKGCFPGVTLVEGNARVEIAITSMGQIGDTQTIAFANGHDAAQRLGQFGAWHTAIDNIAVRAQTGHRPECRTPAQPQACGSLGTLGGLDREDIVLPTEGRDHLLAAWHVLLETVELNNQGSPGVGRIAYVYGLIHRLHDGLIEEFQRRWQEPSANNVRARVGASYH